MVAKVHAATLVGIEAVPIVVEVDTKGAEKPEFFLVGLTGGPDSSLRRPQKPARRTCPRAGPDGSCRVCRGCVQDHVHRSTHPHCIVDSNGIQVVSDLVADP